jgi:hypothetical protein
MWAPVILTPLVIGATLAAVARRDGIWGWVGALFLAVGVLGGLLGLYYHLRAVAYQIGGLFSLRNLMAGPPPVLPLAYSLIGVLGLLGLFLHG